MTTNEGTNHVRVPKDSREEWLVDIGWKMRGLTLFEYTNADHIRGYYSCAAAIEISEDIGLDLYCSLCGACGEEGCCSPDRCKCLYHEHYKHTYQELLKENELLYTFLEDIAGLEDSRADERYELVHIVKQKIKEI